jgi:ribosomal protein L37AE/L43A
MSLLAFLKRFPDDDACWAHLEAVRWPAGPACPKCGTVGNAQPQKSRPHYWQCRGCRAVFTAAMGTPLEGTHLPMRSWFTALHLLAVSSKGISSVKLGEHLGIGQKTAWFVGHASAARWKTRTISRGAGEPERQRSDARGGGRSGACSGARR